MVHRWIVPTLNPEFCLGEKLSHAHCVTRGLFLAPHCHPTAHPRVDLSMATFLILIPVSRFAAQQDKPHASSPSIFMSSSSSFLSHPHFCDPVAPCVTCRPPVCVWRPDGGEAGAGRGGGVAPARRNLAGSCSAATPAQRPRLLQVCPRAVQPCTVSPGPGVDIMMCPT